MSHEQYKEYEEKCKEIVNAIPATAICQLVNKLRKNVEFKADDEEYSDFLIALGDDEYILLVKTEEVDKMWELPTAAQVYEKMQQESDQIMLDGINKY